MSWKSEPSVQSWDREIASWVREASRTPGPSQALVKAGCCSAFAPAGKMKAFFGIREQRGIKPGQYASTKEDAALLREFGMELIGPPIPLASL